MSQAMSKCISNGIKVYPIVENRNQLRLVININGTEKHGDKLFNAKPSKRDDKWWDKVYAIYEQLSQKL